MDSLPLLQEISSDIQELKRALVKLSLLLSRPLKDDWLRSDQVMKVLGISQSTLTRLRREKVLPFTKLGGILYLKASDLELWLKNNHIPKKEEENGK